MISVAEKYAALSVQMGNDSSPKRVFDSVFGSVNPEIVLSTVPSIPTRYFFACPIINRCTQHETRFFVKAHFN